MILLARFSILISVKSWAALGFVFSIKNKKYSKNPGLVTIRLDLSVVCWSKLIICVLAVREKRSEFCRMRLWLSERKGLNLSNASGLNFRWLVSGQTSGQSRCRSV